MYINLFKTFFKIGIVTFGGGYAMIPMIEEDVVRRNKWVSKDEFIDLPSLIIILLIAMFFHQFQNNSVVAAMFAGIRPAVVALIAAPTFTLAKDTHINLANCWIPIAGALAIWLLGVNPIWVIVAAAFGGYIYGKYIKPTE